MTKDYMILKIPTRKALILLEKEMQRGLKLFHETGMKPWMIESLPLPPDSSMSKHFTQQVKTGHERRKYFYSVKKWSQSLPDIFEEIFENSEPRIRLLDVHFPRAKQGESSKLQEFIQGKLLVIADYYRLIEEQMFSSLRYIDSRLVLVYGDAVVELEENSNGQSLCKFMFENYDLEQRAPLHKVHEYITGEPLPANPRAKGVKVVQSAVNSVNRKTKKSFGFSVFSHPRGTVFIKNPKTRNLS